MKLSIYAIRDIKNEFCTPFTTNNDAMAKRMFMNEQRNKDSMLAQFPADFELYKLADIDTKTGQICPNLVNIAIQGDENV